MFNAMIETLKANPRKIVFTEGHDARILEATDRLVKGGFLTPILIGNVDVVKANAAKGGYNIEGVEIIDPETYPEMDAMVDKMVEKLSMATLGSMPKTLAVLAVSIATSASFWAADRVTLPSLSTESS